MARRRIYAHCVRKISIQVTFEIEEVRGQYAEPEGTVKIVTWRFVRASAPRGVLAEPMICPAFLTHAEWHTC